MNYSYSRLSTDENQQANSFGVQEQHIKDQYDINKCFRDTVSGSMELANRPSWVELMSTATKGDTIVVHRLDRLSRNSLDFLIWQKQLETKGIELKYIEGQNGDDAMSKMVRTILVAVAELERSLISTRIKQAKAKLKAESRHTGGSLPYGYDKDSDGYLIPNSKEQSVIEVMKDGRDNMNLSYGKLAGYLDDLGHKTRKGTSFTSMTVSRILKYNE